MTGQVHQGNAVGLNDAAQAVQANAGGAVRGLQRAKQRVPVQAAQGINHALQAQNLRNQALNGQGIGNLINRNA